MKRKWVELEEFPNYIVSDLGEIVNLKHDNELTPTRNQQGLARVGLLKDGRQMQRSVAVLVAKAFVPGRTDIFNTPINLNGERMDNRSDNLMWRPRWFAIKYHQQFQIPEFHAATPHIVEMENEEEFHSLKEPCMKFGLVWTDVIRSYVQQTHVFPTGQEFRYIGD